MSTPPIRCSSQKSFFKNGVYIRCRGSQGALAQIGLEFRATRSLHMVKSLETVCADQGLFDSARKSDSIGSTIMCR
jgi:hypothetical protein